ncbi:hypothetical protein FD46_GL000528 [Liquorilactobacillus oeni DSM 19972]|uniref:Uncharacterized protein n=1 Tax=Liquorilactobacillus oeni DSM 19972 TaxID=1423777 RepID=A0A0R1MCE5_9LACO|nr:hypothetical protein FD46_GL000528 [Liquorilactobacillus oeni DSM 19972]
MIKRKRLTIETRLMGIFSLKQRGLDQKLTFDPIPFVVFCCMRSLKDTQDA